MFDNHLTLLSGTIQTPPTPATTGQTLTLMPGDTRFQPNIPLTLCPSDAPPSHDNAEVVYVPAVNGLELTIVRAQEDSIAKPVAAGWLVFGTMTVKTITDIEDAVVTNGDELLDVPRTGERRG